MSQVVERNFVEERKYQRNQFLRQLGTFGWEPISRFVFASALTGTPICVYGTHGAGKTMTFRRLAQKAFNKSYCLYDASKANLVDIIGYPNVESFKKGKMDFVRTPMSIWDKSIIILDEITRAREDIQNSYLEVLRNRTMQGVPTGADFVFTAANTLEYAGTRPLDEAFASRIGYYCEVPELLDMRDDDQELVVSAREGCDSPGLRFWNTTLQNPEDLIPDISEEFRNFMGDVSEYYQQVSDVYREMFVEYIRMFSTNLKSRTRKRSSGDENKKNKSGSEIKLDARTNVTLVSNMLANVALESWEFEKLGIKFTDNHLREVVIDTIFHSFPWALTGQEVNKAAVSEAHEQAYRILKTQDMVAYMINNEKNPVRRVMLALHMDDLEPVALFDAIEELLENDKSKEAVLFCLLVKDRKEVLKKLNDKPELSSRISGIAVSALKTALGVKVDTTSNNVEYGRILETEFKVDLTDPVVTDPLLRMALLYLRNRYANDLWKMDLITFQTDVKEMYALSKGVEDLLQYDYNKIREHLLKLRSSKN